MFDVTSKLLWLALQVEADVDFYGEADWKEIQTWAKEFELHQRIRLLEGCIRACPDTTNIGVRYPAEYVDWLVRFQSVIGEVKQRSRD